MQGQKQKWLSLKGMSVLPPTADMRRLHRNVSFVPEAVSEPEIIAPPIEPIVDRPFNFNTDAFAHRSQQ
jgi:hypothetical protein